MFPLALLTNIIKWCKDIVDTEHAVINEGSVGYIREADDGKVIKYWKDDSSRTSVESELFFYETMSKSHIAFPQFYGIVPDIGSRWKIGMVIEKLSMDLWSIQMLRFEHLNKVFTARQVASIIIPIWDALRKMHKEGMVHRDIKPENIMVRGDFSHLTEESDPPTELSDTVLIDFGMICFISKDHLIEFINRKDEYKRKDTLSYAIGLIADESDTIKGTAAYIAPECYVRRASTRPKVDVWALNVVAIELMTGRNPFNAASFQDIQDATLNRTWLPPLTWDLQLQEIIRGGLHKNPRDRWSSQQMYDAWMLYWNKHKNS
jgi:serine/threonine protein kinase